MMDSLEGFLNRSVHCEACGRSHAVSVRQILYAEDAVERLADWMRRELKGECVMVVADRRTWEVAGARSREALSSVGYGGSAVMVPDPDGGGDPVCDDITHEWLCRQTEHADLLVACGSGVINDLTKWSSWTQGKPYAVVPTALSMNGYVSANVAPLLDGLKSVVYTHEPLAVAARPSVLKEAPPRMTAAGLGDVIAKPVSTADWAMNTALFGEYYCPFCAGLISDIEPIYMDAPEAIRDAQDDGLRALFEALILTGFSMSMAGTSFPASGGEHLISHSLDMMALRDGIEHDFHGRQVGVGTIFCAALYERLSSIETPRPVVPACSFDPAFWGRFTQPIEEEYAEKRKREHAAATMLQARPRIWERLRQNVRASVPTPKRLKTVLQRAGAAHRLADIGVDRSRFLDAVTHAHEMRERFTVLGLARCMGVLPDAAPDLVDEWLDNG